MSERNLYLCFKEVLYDDLSLSDRIVGTGTLPLLLDLLSYCFASADPEIHDPDVLDVASSLCRSDCSVYCKKVYVNGVAQLHYYLHHIPSWLRKG
jgi:hypothetical protein